MHVNVETKNPTQEIFYLNLSLFMAKTGKVKQ